MTANDDSILMRPEAQFLMRFTFGIQEILKGLADAYAHGCINDQCHRHEVHELAFKASELHRELEAWLDASTKAR